MGRGRHSRTSCFYRATPAQGTTASAHRSADPVAKPYDVFFHCSFDRAGAASRLESIAATRLRFSTDVRAGHSRRGRVQLPLLPRDSKNRRSHRHHLAIHGANLGIAIYRRARPTEAHGSANRGRGLAVTGIALVIGIFGSTGFRLDAIGVIAALGAAFSFAFYNVGGHSILARYDRWTVLLYVILSASLFWIVVNPPWKIAAAHYSVDQWLFLLVFSLISVLAPFSLYFAGLQHLEPTRAIVVSCLEPVFSIVIAAVALGEIVRPLQTVGIVLVLVAIVVVQLPDRRLHEEMTLVEPME